MATRLYDKEWRAFAEWCEDRGLKSLPAHPWTVAAYVRWCEPRQNLQFIIDSLKSITRVHLLKCHRTPERNVTVKKILRQIEVRALNKDTRAALFQAEDFAETMQKAASNVKAEKDIDDLTTPVSEEEPEALVLRRSMRSTPRLVRRLARRNTT